MSAGWQKILEPKSRREYFLSPDGQVAQWEAPAAAQVQEQARREAQAQREAEARAKRETEGKRKAEEQARRVAQEQARKGAREHKMNTSNVAKWQGKLRTQLQSVKYGLLNGWWVVNVQANNGGSTGPGIITLSDVRPI